MMVSCTLTRPAPHAQTRRSLATAWRRAVLPCRPNDSALPSQGKSRPARICAAAAPGDAEGEPEQPRQPGLTNSGEWKAVSVPFGVPTAGSTFLLAGFLKLLTMCFPYSPIAVAMYLGGRADLGYWAVVKMMPLALGMTALAKYIIDRRLLERRWVRWAVVLGSIAALFLSRLLFAGPKPNHVLNKAMRAAEQARVVEMAAAQAAEQRRAAARASALKGQHDVQQFRDLQHMREHQRAAEQARRGR